MDLFQIKMYAKYLKILKEQEMIGEGLKKKEFIRKIV